MTLPTAVNADVSRTYKIWIVLGICLLLVGVIRDKPDGRIPINWFYGLVAGDAGIATVRL